MTPKEREWLEQMKTTLDGILDHAFMLHNTAIRLRDSILTKIRQQQRKDKRDET